ncbi:MULTISPECIES: SIMPL domain-containing protein [unclassified Mycolicibacterium]|uniref:SIMPL domain-containing protein n=1 Tax=unclassified Mycolicibacterium TaxID=2636767 RepID=UPI0012DF26FB|nr:MULTISPECIES: SIMPL domain-containing protein [unclassified Mycolicibacterium]MUL84201.1 SIMPL domain-containing protein [Mycolicibacterium sp. CBMA 329]MUL89733.1 SIMPL domain-containing protein [Mycolicibacterium sp. CBMA 331]MUL99908.1 SIMPL domain-containing protein [Mycolicibacterium sp. CBMA 334]MUM27062.1 SIMPL domain-containing protein [Mycolicibacterium sp. CBMA 295]MUM39248.1 SIMPL domain-containing protein [Mycolicibacterium sp. CBMA 247]
MPTEIIVRGSFSAFQPPERATVHATLGYEGPAIEPVYERVVRDLDMVKSSITPLHNPDAGPVTWWSTGQVRTWANRPWNNEGKQLPLVHHASVDVEVKFSDFTALSRWVGGHITDTGGFSLSRIEWALTAKHRDELVSQVHTRAVQDAVTRAQRYSDALGLGPVRPLAIGDAGMLGRNPEDPSAPKMMRAMAIGGGGAPELEFAPADIEVSVSVDAKFVAGES